MKEVTTNNGRFLTDASNELLRQYMFLYIRKMKAKGYKLNEIIFCWSSSVPYRHAASLAVEIKKER